MKVNLLLCCIRIYIDIYINRFSIKNLIPSYIKVVLKDVTKWLLHDLTSCIWWNKYKYVIEVKKSRKRKRNERKIFLTTCVSKTWINHNQTLNSGKTCSFFTLLYTTYLYTTCTINMFIYRSLLIPLTHK